MRKLLLINPVGRRSGYLLSRFSTFQPLGLAYTAAVTPSHWEVKIADENIEPFEFEEADLVGITAFTSNINRAYEIARLYKEKGIKVIIGGIHGSMLPDEALQYADSVVIGEVEGGLAVQAVFGLDLLVHEETQIRLHQDQAEDHWQTPPSEKSKYLAGSAAQPAERRAHRFETGS